MITRVNEPLRLKVAIMAAASSALAAGLVAVAASRWGASAAIGLATLGALGSGTAAWLALAPLGKALRAARDVVEGMCPPSDCPAMSGELSAFSEAFRGLGDRVMSLVEGYQADLAAVARALTDLNDPRGRGQPADLSLPGGKSNALFRNAFEELKTGLAWDRSQLALATRILKILPEPVLVTDGAGVVRFVNRAAERAIGRDAPAVVKTSVARLFRPPGPTGRERDDTFPVAVGPAEVLGWIKGGTKGLLVARAGGAGEPLMELSGATSRSGSSEILVCILGRELTGPLRREAGDRATVRANA